MSISFHPRKEFFCMLKTCEFVTPKHPDKQCDIIADTLLDEYLKQDPYSRVAIEVMGGHGRITLSGEVTSKASVDVVQTVQNLVGANFSIESFIEKQSPEISRGVDVGGAGDQGIMVGYATSDTQSFLPREYELAQQLCEKLYQQFPFDGKVQVTIDGTKATSVVASFQNVSAEVLNNAVKQLIEAQEYHINPAGDWNLGGFDADSGLSGRKIIIDNYGPNIPVGGGSFSGKDATKVDRSAAYMARFAAKNIVAQGLAKECLIKIAYAIGVVEPVMLVATNEKGEDISELVRSKFDFRPQAIIERLDLRRPIYSQTAKSGHFGYGGLPWEQLA